MPLTAPPDPPGLGLLASHAEALASGLSRDQIRHRVRSGRWRALGRGRYLLDLGLPPGASVWEIRARTHALTAVSAATQRERACVGVASAATVHGLPLLPGPPASVHLLVPPGSWTSSHSGIRWRQADVPLAQTVTAGSALPGLSGRSALVPVTVPARTWVDIARGSSLPASLVVGDAALRAGTMSLAECADLLAGAHPRAFGHAATALRLLDARRETPLESVSYANFVMWELPLPLLQQPIHDDRGFVGRVDFLWEELGLIGEADGILKYSDRAVLIAEKRREDRLRTLGYRVVRWTWDELMRSPDLVLARIRAAMRAAT